VIAKEPFEEAVIEEETQRVRVDLCELLNAALTDYGYKLFVTGNAIAGGPTNAQDPDVKDILERTIGLSCVVQIAGELGVACVNLLQTDQIYASFALVRQIVECEYLCWAFAHDQDEARKWLNSTRAERLSFWSPRHMRQRSQGEFRDKDYAVHCEFGGHPTPRAFSLLRISRTVYPNAIWLELTSHLVNVWSHTTRAIPEIVMPLMDRKPGPQGTGPKVTAAVNAWIKSDPAIEAAAKLPDFPTFK
jgi:hypothetical protein